MLAVLALNATTLGIPCIYYGSEQLFDGEGGNDRYLRECMFGGALRRLPLARRAIASTRISGSTASSPRCLRSAANTSRCGAAANTCARSPATASTIGLPHMIGDEIRSIVPWSRLFDRSEILLAVNTDRDAARDASVIIDADLHAAGSTLTCLYSTAADEIGRTIRVADRGDGAKVVRLSAPAAGFVMYA